MADRPILMSAPMVRATLDGRKTQTRRPAWRDCRQCGGSGELAERQSCPRCHTAGQVPSRWQKVEPGDRLWVKETFYETDKISRIGLIDGKPCPVVFRADWPEDEWRFAKWTSSIFMPREFSRLTLVVTDVRMERLQDISDDDCFSEGISGEEQAYSDAERAQHSIGHCQPYSPEKWAYLDLWESLHGPGAWDANPEVVVLTFTAHQRNIDQMENTP